MMNCWTLSPGTRSDCATQHTWWSCGGCRSFSHKSNKRRHSRPRRSWTERAWRAKGSGRYSCRQRCVDYLKNAWWSQCSRRARHHDMHNFVLRLLECAWRAQCSRRTSHRSRLERAGRTHGAQQDRSCLRTLKPHGSAGLKNHGRMRRDRSQGNHDAKRK